MSRFFFIIFLLFVSGNLLSQSDGDDCPPFYTSATIHSNQIRTAILNNGALFWDAESSRFQVPFEIENPVHSIFVAGLWLASRDQNNELLLAASTVDYHIGKTDFWPGPLNLNGTSNPDLCVSWNRIWRVFDFEIETHLQDLNDNGVINDPQFSILSWPGKGNIHFSDLMGFSLPENANDLAPFNDINQNGKYEPLKGEHPVTNLPGNPIATEMLWCLMNDNAGTHSLSGGKNLGVEIQLMVAAFHCSTNPILNNTLFTSYTIVNRNEIQLPDFKMGLLADFDLGCFQDDYLGCSPGHRSAFVYNKDNQDGQGEPDCPFGENSYGNAPPVQSLTFLNQDLSSFMAIFDGWGAVDPPPGVLGPNIAEEFNHYLNARWRDGTPLTFSEDGYDPDGILTDFAFVGDPSDPEQWSMLEVGLPAFNYKGVLTANLGDLLPSSEIQVDLAWTLHGDTSNNNLENVSLMYYNLDTLLQLYESGDWELCTSEALCAYDCVWPGDTNADGIANHYDLLPIVRTLTEVGPLRDGLPIWRPHEADEWATDWNNTNLKHADTDGNGAITIQDLLITELHYNQTRPDYFPEPDQYPNGPQISFAPLLSYSFDDLNPGNNLWFEVNVSAIPEVVGLAFTIEFDRRYIQDIELLTEELNCEANGCVRLNSTEGHILTTFEFDIAVAHQEDQELFFKEESFLQFIVKMAEEFPSPLPSNTTKIRVKNIQAINAEGDPVHIGSSPAILTMANVPVSAKNIYQEKIKVYPNPAHIGFLTIEGMEGKDSRILLYDLNGILIDQWICKKCNWIELSTIHLADGLYFLELRQDQASFRKKIVISRQ